MSSTLSDPPADKESMSGIFATAPTFSTQSPAWRQQTQKEAWREFQSLPMPSSKNEAWRFASLRKMELEGYAPAPTATDTIEAKCLATSQESFNEGSHNFVFVNGRLVHPPQLPETFEHAGIVCCPLNTAAERHPELLQRYLHSQEATLGGEKFSALHRANDNPGIFLYVPEDVIMESPIEITHWISSPEPEKNALFPHCLVIAEKLAQATVLERFLSADDNVSFSCGAVDLHASEGAKIHYTSLQNLNLNSRFYQLHSNQAARQANITNCQVNLGGGWSRSEAIAHLNGKSANIDMLCVNVAEGSQEFDHRSFQHHAEAHCTSDLLYKNCLFDQTKSVFAGLISVDEEAHFTDAYQTCRNLLMSDEAEAHSMPGLEINADQVKCSHGSTTSRIEEEELFYLRARGLTRSAARKIILLGYCMDVVDRLDNETHIEELRDLIEAKFRGVAA